MKTISLYIALLLSFTSLAQVSFTASVANEKIEQGQRFAVEFKVNQRGESFQAPDFNGFTVLGGPNTSVSTFMDNTGTRFNLTFSYILQAKSTGQFIIGPAYIKVDGETYRTQNLDVNVSKETKNTREQPENKDLILKAIVSKQSVYQGEPIYTRYRLFFRTEIGQHSYREEPSFKGFYKEAINEKRIETSEESLNGQRYYAADLQKMVIIPQQSGELKPGAIVLNVPIRINSGRRDFFGFPITRLSNVELKADFPTITVKPLPTKGKPDDFSGAVGQYNFTVKLNNTAISTDESVTLRIELSGTGNIKLIDIPNPEFPQAFEVFDPEITERSNVGSYGMKGSKLIEYLLVPRYSGTYKIKPITFSFFNPKSASYQTISSESFAIEVKGDKLPIGSSGQVEMSGNEKEEVGFISKKILFLKTDAGKWQKRSDQFWLSFSFWSWFTFLFALNLALYIFWIKKNKNRANPGAMREQKAAKKASKRLKNAKKALEQNRASEFYQELLAALWGYFSDKLKMPAHEQSRARLQELLAAKGISSATQQRLAKIIDQAEMASYTEATMVNAQSDYQEASALLTEIEGEL
jgi:hypothetical protein